MLEQLLIPCVLLSFSALKCAFRTMVRGADGGYNGAWRFTQGKVITCGCCRPISHTWLDLPEGALANSPALRVFVQQSVHFVNVTLERVEGANYEPCHQMAFWDEFSGEAFKLALLGCTTGLPPELLAGTIKAYFQLRLAYRGVSFAINLGLRAEARRLAEEERLREEWRREEQPVGDLLEEEMPQVPHALVADFNSDAEELVLEVEEGAHLPRFDRRLGRSVGMFGEGPTATYTLRPSSAEVLSAVEETGLVPGKPLQWL